jgi:hypothetical protein
VVCKAAFERGGRNDRESRVAFALDGLVNGTDGRAGSDVEGGTGEDEEWFGSHGRK